MLLAAFSQYFFGFTIFISSIFLVLLVLVQRGRGGGLTGALGGPGGQSAFGTKAGDLFTRITVGVAAVWIFLCAAAVFFLKDRGLPQTGVMGNDEQAAVGALNPGDETTSGTTSSNAGTGSVDSTTSGNRQIELPSADGSAPAKTLDNPPTEAEVSDSAGLEPDSVTPPTPATTTPQH